MKKKPLIIASVIGGTLTLGLLLNLPKSKPTTLSPTPEILHLPALQAAHQKFQERGNTYIWGPNDCSVFVTDYLRAHGAPVKQRLTTAQLIQKQEMAPLGFYPTLQNPKPGDVIVYRYQSKKTNRPAGHCGVILQHDEKLWVAHNAMSFGGLVVQDLSDFTNTALDLGVNRADIAIFAPKPN